MFRRAIWEVPEEYVADLAGNSGVVLLVGRIPIGTCGNVRKEDVSFEARHAHAIGLLGKRLDHQPLILLSPFAHPLVRADGGADILDDVLLLPSLVVE